ncbi:ABC transporter permease [Humibacter albus]|uniref:ABC transporter permease n=1 Tax=Humibacter albus TaxID=427754 RepID=UPI0003B5116B|nr:ABC transporter permease [Humibacter albus]
MTAPALTRTSGHPSSESTLDAPHRGAPHLATGIALWAWFGVAVLFLFSPIVTAVWYSFNVGVDGKQTSAFTGFTGDWYVQAFTDPTIRQATGTSLVVAFWAAVIAVLIGTILGFELARNPNRIVRRLLAGLTYILLIVPETVLGVSLLLFYTETHVSLSEFTLIAALTPPSISVVAFVIRARVLTLDAGVEDAAADLGASRLATLSTIVLPQLGPAIGAAALIAYTFAFDNVVIANFLSTPTVNVLTVYLYGTLQYGATPAVYATAVVIFAATIVVLALAALLLRTTLRRAVRGRDSREQRALGQSNGADDSPFASQDGADLPAALVPDRAGEPANRPEL